MDERQDVGSPSDKPQGVERLRVRELRKVRGTGDTSDPTSMSSPNSGSTFCACGCPIGDTCGPPG